MTEGSPMGMRGRRPAEEIMPPQINRGEATSPRLKVLPGGEEKRARTTPEHLSVIDRDGEHSVKSKALKRLTVEEIMRQYRTAEQLEQAIKDLTHEYFILNPNGAIRVTHLRNEFQKGQLDKGGTEILELFDKITELIKIRKQPYFSKDRQNILALSESMAKQTDQTVRQKKELQKPPSIDDLIAGTNETGRGAMDKRPIDVGRQKRMETQEQAKVVERTKLLKELLTNREQIMDIKIGGVLGFFQKKLAGYFEMTINKGLSEQAIATYIKNSLKTNDPLKGLRPDNITVEELGEKIGKKDLLGQNRYKKYTDALKTYQHSLTTEKLYQMK